MNRAAAIFLVALCGLCCAARGQVTYTVTTIADAFVATGSPNNPEGDDLSGNNYGGAGTLAISPASALKGEFRSVIKFDLSGAPGQFTAAYGTNWVIGGVSLELTSNYGQQGAQPNNPIFNAINTGNFVIEWMSDDTWVEGSGNPSFPTVDGITFDTLPDFLMLPHIPLCTNTYVPPGNNIPVTWRLPLNTNLVTNILAGGQVSFYFYAADNQVGYLFNSYSYGRGNQPLIHVTANPLIEIQSAFFTNGVFELSGFGQANAQYQVQANTNVASTNWQGIGSVTTDGNGQFQFSDTTGSTQARRFYRLSH
jgi:hypothetical protein